MFEATRSEIIRQVHRPLKSNPCASPVVDYLKPLSTNGFRPCHMNDSYLSFIATVP